MRKHLLRAVSLFSTAALLGTSISHPVYGEEVTKSGVIAKEIHSQQEMKREADQAPLLSDEILIVKYKSPLSQSELQRSGLVLIKHIPTLKTAVVKLKNKKNMDAVIQRFAKMDHIENIHPSALYKPYGSGDPKVDKQYYIQMLDIQKAQALAGKSKVRIAVIDQGIDMNHPELKGKLLPSYNAVNPMSAGMPDYHGTHVAGIIASGKDNGIGGIGVNPNVEILPIDVFDRGWGATDYTIAQGILYAIEKNVKVINLSLGGPYSSQIVKDAIKKAADKGIVIVAAAGNSGNEVLNYPASYEGVISVGNVDENKKLAKDSSFGPAIDLVAPGENIYNTIYEYEKKSSFREMSGTSMASPIVAGVASLLLSKNPSLTPAEIEYILKHTSSDLGAKGFDIQYGSGLVNPVKALEFNPKNIPSYIKNGSSERKKAIDKAVPLDINSEQIISENITKPHQENWVKINVKAGQTLQLQLQGNEQFDYKLMGKWLNSDKEEFEINEVGHGVTEGVVMNIEEDGILAIGIKDVHGQYDDSGSKQSYYHMKVTLADDVPAHLSDISNPIALSLPAKDKSQTLFSPSGEVDEDYYSVKVQEPKMVRVSLSGLPGVDTAITVYRKDTENLDLAIEATESAPEMFLPPIKYENRKGKSEGESLVFSAEENVEYIVKVSNQPEFLFGYFEYYMDPSLIENQPKPMSSLDPYELTVEGYVLPEDEDQFSMNRLLNEQETLALEQKMVEMPGSYFDRERDYTEMIKSIAIPVTSEPVRGYLQIEGDQDWYQLEAASDGLYKLELQKGTLKPSVEVFQIRKEKVKEEEFEYFSSIGYNNDWWSYNLKDEIYLSLEKGRTYYIKAEANYMDNSGISIDPYQFQVKKIADIKKDPYEPNDQFEEAKDLKSAKITSSFNKPNDSDIYYLQAKENTVYGVSINPSELTSQLKASYPESVLQPFESFFVIYEDVNKNRKLDDKEMESAQYIEKGIFTGKTFGSFKAKKNANYFIAVSSYFQSNASFSLRPYELSIKPIVKKDEDPQNTGANLQKVKPLKMKQKADSVYQSEGYFNAEIGYGDEDWYSFSMNKNGKASITLEVPSEIDGQLEVYQNGRMINSSDYYPEGDNEVLHMNLNKGEYWIKVKEAYNQTSIEPYKLIVKVQ